MAGRVWGNTGWGEGGIHLEGGGSGDIIIFIYVIFNIFYNRCLGQDYGLVKLSRCTSVLLLLLSLIVNFSGFCRAVVVVVSYPAPTNLWQLLHFLSFFFDIHNFDSETPVLPSLQEQTTLLVSCAAMVFL